MSNVIRAQLGGHVPLRIKTRERRTDAQDGRLFAVNGLRITDIKDDTGTSIGGSFPAFTFVTDGEYVAHWDTSARSAGDYVVEIDAMVGWDTVAATGHLTPKRIKVRLVAQGAP